MKGWIVFLTAVLYAGAFAQVPSTNFSSCNFQAIGHRGYSSVYPENTLLALEEAFKRGIKICEIDVRVSTDDVYILFHDSEALHRTSNGAGAVGDMPLAELLRLDAGAWKGEHFAGLTIPTLEDALLLAQEYDAQLYLDTKTLRLDLLQLAIETTGVEEDRLLPSLNDSVDIANFTALLPNSPWVWFQGGLYPEAVDSPEFYQSMVDKNCIAFEVSSSRVNDEEWLSFEENVHLAGAKTWVFTENDETICLDLFNNGVDAIETDRPWEIMEYACNGIKRTFPDSITRGNWRFVNGLHNVVGIGSQLRLADYADPNPFEKPLFGRCEQFSIADLETGSDSVMYVPKQSEDGGLFVYTNAVVEDYGIEDQHYSIVMDVLFPESSLGNWISLFQTNTSNLNDAELFINPQNQIGISEQYFGNILPNTWYRITVTVNISAGFMKLYIDGVLQGEIEIETNRWAVINSSASGEKQGFLLFADDNGETQDVFLSALQFRDYELDAASIAILGGVQTAGIPSGNADVWKVDLPGVEVIQSMLDYDNETYHLWVSELDIGQQEIQFLLSKNATASPFSGSILDWATQKQTIEVVSEDGSNSKRWTVVLHPEIVGVGDSDDLQLVVYPNPTSDKVRVVFSEGGKAVLTVVSAHGVDIFTDTMYQQEYELDVSGFSSGTYVLRVSLNGRSYHRLFSKL